MKTAVSISLYFGIILSCQVTKPATSESNEISWFDKWRSAEYVEDSTITGHTFSSYRGGTTYTFNENGTYDFRLPHPHPRYPASYHSGYYTIADDTIILKDTICYKIENFDSVNADTVECNEPGTRYLYKTWVVNRLCLSNIPADTLETEVIIDRYLLKRD